MKATLADTCMSPCPSSGRAEVYHKMQARCQTHWGLQGPGACCGQCPHTATPLAWSAKEETWTIGVAGLLDNRHVLTPAYGKVPCWTYREQGILPQLIRLSEDLRVMWEASLQTCCCIVASHWAKRPAGASTRVAFMGSSALPSSSSTAWQAASAWLWTACPLPGSAGRVLDLLFASSSHLNGCQGLLAIRLRACRVFPRPCSSQSRPPRSSWLCSRFSSQAKPCRW